MYENTVLTLTPMRIELSSTSLEFNTCDKSSRNVTVKATGMDWAFTDIPDWITVSPSSGKGGYTEVNIEVSENASAVNRMSLINFGSVGGDCNYSMQFLVSQHHAPYTISLPVDMMRMDSDGGDKTVLVDTNTDTWTIMVPESMSWCTARKTNDGLVLTLGKNNGTASRIGVIELHTDDVSAFLTVIQRPSGVSSSEDCVEFPVEGGIRNISLSIDMPWEIKTTCSWIDIKTRSGSAGYVTIPMEATPNFSSMSRDDNIYIVISEDNKIEIPVHQDCIELSVDRETIHVSSSGSTERLNIRSNLSWVISDDIRMYEWLSVNPMSGNGDQQVTVSVEVNPGLESRTATLPISILSQDAGTYLRSLMVEIVQDGCIFGTDSSAIYFQDKAGSTFFNIESDVTWRVNSPDSWISLNPVHGTNNGQVKVTVTENTSDTTRVGLINVVYADLQKTIPVYQSGRYIRVSSDALTFSSLANSTELSLTTNGSWTAEADQSWIGLSGTEGDGDCQILITVQDNPSSTLRDGVVTVMRDEVTPVRVKVRQKARYLNVSTSYMSFFVDGGTSEPVIVQTDGTYDVESESDWITINKETASLFTINVSENAGSMSHTGKVVVHLTDLTSGRLKHEITVVQKGTAIYEYVDLGLSVNWATFNVGATAPEEYGDYFAWGETEPYYEPGYAQSGSPVWKEGRQGGYSWLSYKYCNGSETTLTKYNTDSEYGTVDDKTVLDETDDVAHVLWGGNWRMPTEDEFDELRNNCTWKWTTRLGVDGYEVTSNMNGYTNRSIFLPAAGYRANRIDDILYDGGGLYWAGSGGYYWSSIVYSYEPDCARYLHFNKGIWSSIADRNFGRSVRPVCPPERNEATGEVASIELSASEVSMVVGESVNITANLKDSNGNVIITGVEWSSSNTSVVKVERWSSAQITAVGTGTCTMTASVGDVKSTCLVIVTSYRVVNGSENGHDYVDLGLSVKWATVNVGASQKEDYGDYYAWGETETKSAYNWLTYKYCDGSYNTLTKYCSSIYYGYNGFTDNKPVLDPEDDVAHVKWGGNWRIPTKEEFEELDNVDNCTWTWTSLNGVNGYKITSNISGYDGRFIFLPAAGYRSDSYLNYAGRWGLYQSRSFNDSSSDRQMYFESAYREMRNSDRCQGQSVRPVCP